LQIDLYSTEIASSRNDAQERLAVENRNGLI
jgi:hypothetical protein